MLAGKEPTPLYLCSTTSSRPNERASGLLKAPPSACSLVVSSPVKARYPPSLSLWRCGGLVSEASPKNDTASESVFDTRRAR